jgi:hypothetical protein
MPTPPSDAQVVQFLRRSYHAVDGLWFMGVEDVEGFPAALELDQLVWEVLAKIQARKARELTRCAGNAPEELAACFSLKLSADGHEFVCECAPEGVRFAITDCPWLALLRKSDRQHLARQVAQAICPTEGRVWCAEFGGEYEYDMPRMSCAGAECCEMVFRRHV